MNDKEKNKTHLIEKEKIDYQKEIVKYLNEFDRFLYKVALSVKTKCRRLEVEDVKQQIILVILSNYKKFNNDKTIKYSSYLSQIAINAANNIVRRYWQEKNRINVSYVSLDAFIDEQNYQFVTLLKEDEDSLLYPENYYNINEIERKIVDIKDILSSFERKVFMMYLQGKEINQIASKLKKSSKTIYNALAVIRDKLKEKM